jgi:hypothetical protein
MGGIEYDKHLVVKAMEEVMTYDTIKSNYFLDIVGMVAERLNCVCIDKDNHYYMYINHDGELSGDGTYVFNKIMNLMMKYGYKELLKKRWYDGQ